MHNRAQPDVPVGPAGDNKVTITKLTLLDAPAWPLCVLQFLRFIILLSNMIPISLYVSLEVVKVFQCALLLNQDRGMYHL